MEVSFFGMGHYDEAAVGRLVLPRCAEMTS